MEDDENQGFKVKDKRRFDSEGNQKSGQEPAPAKPAQSGSASPKTQSTVERKPQTEPSENYGDSAMEINFSSFVVSLATQAMMQLGVLEAPPGMEIPVDIQAAKQTIEILQMLEQKTKGNLENEEARLIDEVLHNLRMSFVRAKG